MKLPVHSFCAVLHKLLLLLALHLGTQQPHTELVAVAKCCRPTIISLEADCGISQRSEISSTDLLQQRHSVAVPSSDSLSSLGRSDCMTPIRGAELCNVHFYYARPRFF